MTAQTNRGNIKKKKKKFKKQKGSETDCVRESHLKYVKSIIPFFGSLCSSQIPVEQPHTIYYAKNSKSSRKQHI